MHGAPTIDTGALFNWTLRCQLRPLRPRPLIFPLQVSGQLLQLASPNRALAATPIPIPTASGQRPKLSAIQCTRPPDLPFVVHDLVVNVDQPHAHSCALPHRGLALGADPGLLLIPVSVACGEAIARGDDNLERPRLGHHGDPTRRGDDRVDCLPDDGAEDEARVLDAETGPAAALQDAAGADAVNVADEEDKAEAAFHLALNPLAEETLEVFAELGAEELGMEVDLLVAFLRGGTKRGGK